MSMILNGYDLDGTICDAGPMRDTPYFQQTPKEKDAYAAAVKAHYHTARLLRRPASPFAIITGRLETYRRETLDWLIKNHLYPMYVKMLDAQPTLHNMIEHKLFWCRKLKIATYYEDDAVIAAALEASGIAVIKVGDEDL